MKITTKMKGKKSYKEKSIVKTKEKKEK